MKVKELIEQLSKMNPESEVYINHTSGDEPLGESYPVCIDQTSNEFVHITTEAA